jgi:predicted nucleotidyltransferase
MTPLDYIPLSDSDRRAIRVAAQVLRAHLPIREVVLLGSKARGRDDPESDIDLLVLMEPALSREEQRLVVHLHCPLELEYDVVFSTLEVSVADWYEGVYQALPLRAEVERDGVAA